MAKPKIGLALGSGGARGLAHLGVLSSLHKHQIEVDMIAGSSMGALVGSFYAAGHDVETMKKSPRLSNGGSMLIIRYRNSVF